MSSLREAAEAELEGKLLSLVTQKEELVRDGCVRMASTFDQDIRELSVLRVRVLMRTPLSK